MKNSTHPEYRARYTDWEKFRYTKNGGADYIEEYLVTYSAREDDGDFENRKTITPIPGFASAALIDVKNAIFQRLSDITRTDGSKTYEAVMAGKLSGIDLRESTMNHFIGREVLPELLFLGKVGVYVDMPVLPENHSKLESNKAHPYFYIYRAEQIKNWVHNGVEYTSVLIEEEYLKHDSYGLPSGTEKRYRLLQKLDDGVLVSFFKDDENDPFDVVTLPLKRIPFVLFELEHSMLQDIANHQIALLNMESADVAYALQANFPFYTEQDSGYVGTTHLKTEESNEDGSDINVGATQGRRYSKGMDRPGFINPSSEPLRASMEKQKNLKDDIRGLINLALSAIRPKFSSAESKQMDEKGLESGLSFLGLVLEQGERQLATIFSDYERDNKIATIHYPERYNLKTDRQRIDEANELGEQMAVVPSKTFQKTISKEIARILFEAKVSSDTMNVILKEIEDAKYISSSAEDIHADIEKGLLSLKLGAVARGYPESEPEQAAKDHAARIARIQEAQIDSGARGLPDLEAGESAKDEKEKSQNPDVQEDGKKAVRT